MKTVILREMAYEIVKNRNDCFNIEEVEGKLTDYFDRYDYIFGDYAYEKLRLKGFNDKDNQNFRQINDIKGLDQYIKEYCSYGADYFLLKKVK